MRPKISVVVWVDEDPPAMEQCMRALASQNLPRGEYEAIFVDAVHARDWQPAFDTFMRLEGPNLNFRLARIGKGGRAKAVNSGVQSTTGDIIIFLADDFLPSPFFVEAHLEYHKTHPELQAVGIGGGIFSEALRANYFCKWLEDSGELFGVSFTKVPERMPPNYFYLGNSSVKRQFLAQAGAFHETFPFPAWDDYEMSLRLAALGMQSRYIPAAQALHNHKIDFEDRCVAMARAGAAAAIFDVVHGPHPLQTQCAVHPYRYRRQAFQSWLRYWLTGNNAHFEEYFHNSLMACFVQGYRTAKRTAN